MEILILADENITVSRNVGYQSSSDEGHIPEETRPQNPSFVVRYSYRPATLTKLNES